MRVYDIIYKKRNGGRLTPEEIRFIIAAYTGGTIPDYQMSALLMAIFIRGMDDGEICELTSAMTASGETVDLSGIPGSKVDKHSTGGVGDGTSLVLAPLAAAAGLVVPMMAGRGLGHTGGTLDKLEAIPGFRVQLSEDEYRRQLARIGAAVIGQTEKVAPADRKIYALRDVTATVDCIPLIAASIMSKKLAEGADGLVLDVKTGSGAFMKDHADARTLAATMLSIGRGCGRKMTALITDMSQPLGRAVGNALEVKQAIEVLRGEGPEDFVTLTVELGARMLTLGGLETDACAAERRLRRCLENGQALEKFREIVAAQGGDPRVADDPDALMPPAPRRIDILSPAAGFVAAIDTTAIGIAGILVGAGRTTKEDAIDYGAGFLIHRKIGDPVREGEPLATMYYTAERSAGEARAMAANAYRIAAERPAAGPLIREELS